MKTCNRCERELPESEFEKRSDRPGGYRNTCKQCLTFQRGRSDFDPAASVPDGGSEPTTTTEEVHPMSTELTAQPSELQQIITRLESGVDMNRKEAETKTEKVKQTGTLLRWQLLELFELKAYKALLYTSWEDYCNERLNINMEQKHLARLLQWARVERNVLISIDRKVTENIPDGDIFKGLPRDTALELNKLPDAEAQRKAYERVTALEKSDLVSKSNLPTAQVKRIVGQLMTGTEEADTTAIKSGPPMLNDPRSPQSPGDYKSKNDVPATPSPVTTFAPKSYPEPEYNVMDVAPEEDSETDTGADIDFAEMADYLRTALTWIENEEVCGTRQDRQDTANSLNAAAQWIIGG